MSKSESTKLDCERIKRVAYIFKLVPVTYHKSPLDPVQYRCPAYICGGALRDTALGLPMKDIDVFVMEVPEALVSSAGNIINVDVATSYKYFTDRTKYFEEVPYSEQLKSIKRIDDPAMQSASPTNRFCSQIYEFKFKDGLTALVNIVVNVTGDIEGLVNNFPINMSQIYLDVKTGKVHRTPSFDDGWRNEIVEVAYNCPIMYENKIKVKFRKLRWHIHKSAVWTTKEVR